MKKISVFLKPGHLAVFLLFLAGLAKGQAGKSPAPRRTNHVVH